MLSIVILLLSIKLPAAIQCGAYSVEIYPFLFCVTQKTAKSTDLNNFIITASIHMNSPDGTTYPNLFHSLVTRGQYLPLGRTTRTSSPECVSLDDRI